MFSFDVSQIDETYLRPCVCAEESKAISKSYCYIEGTELDKSRSDTKEEFGENVWFKEKPPKLFIRDSNPLVSARKIQVSRIFMNGTRTMAPPEEEKKIEKKTHINIKTKRSAVRFLSTTDLED